MPDVVVRPFRDIDATAISVLVGEHARFELAPPPPHDIGVSIADLIRSGRLWCWVAQTPEWNVNAGRFYATFGAVSSIKQRFTLFHAGERDDTR